jgi:tetraacyldisaccharide 4'-kinase
MRAPGFWQTDGLLPRLLSPAASVYAAATALRVARPGWRAPVPVICCGNVGAGGAGKTTLALDLGERLPGAAFLTRGYGGRVRGVVRVDPERHTAVEVGDEALLLAARAPTYVSPDRAAGARAAIADGARVLVMDDGLQNPTLEKNLSILVIDGATGFGNGRVIPAGPLREPVAVAAARCGAAVLIGDDAAGALRMLPTGLPVLRARLEPGARARALAGQRVLAFAGIGRPEKFFATLRTAGAELAETESFGDHHPYAEAELCRIADRAEALGVIAVTTPKDAARLPPAWRARFAVGDVALLWDDPQALEVVLGRA